MTRHAIVAGERLIRRRKTVATSVVSADVAASAACPGPVPSSDGRRHQQILEAARICYVEAEYAGTDLEAVAARACLSTESVLEHFSGTTELYLAAICQAETTFYERLGAVAAGQEGLAAILGEMVRLNTADPTLLRFLQAAAVDVARHSELRAAVGNPWARQEALFREVIEDATAAGEVAAADVETVLSTFNAMAVGLMATGILSPEAQARAVKGLKQVLDGSLPGSHPA
jgi:AcrR family transcriptional regulator